MSNNYTLGTSVRCIRMTKEQLEAARLIVCSAAYAEDGSLCDDMVTLSMIEEASIYDYTYDVMFSFGDGVGDMDADVVKQIVDMVGNQKHAVSFAMYSDKNRQGEQSGMCWLFEPGKDFVVHDTYSISIDFLDKD